MIKKRGQGLETSTLILIVLGVIIFVFLVYGFTIGWGAFFSKISNFAGSSNIDDIRQGCNVACNTNSEYDYNTRMREVKIDKKTKFEASCKQLESELEANDKNRCVYFDTINSQFVPAATAITPITPIEPRDKSGCIAIFGNDVCKIGGEAVTGITDKAICESIFFVEKGVKWSSIITEKCSF